MAVAVMVCKLSAYAFLQKFLEIHPLYILMSLGSENSHLDGEWCVVDGICTIVGHQNHRRHPYKIRFKSMGSLVGINSPVGYFSFLNWVYHFYRADSFQLDLQNWNSSDGY